MDSLSSNDFEALDGLNFDHLNETEAMISWLDSTDGIQNGDYFVLNGADLGFIQPSGEAALFRVDRIDKSQVFAECVKALKHKGLRKSSRMFDKNELTELIRSGKIESVFVPKRAETAQRALDVLDEVPDWLNLQKAPHMETINHPEGLKVYAAELDTMDINARGCRVGDVLISGSGTKRVIKAVKPDGINFVRTTKNGETSEEFIQYDLLRDNFEAQTFQAVQLNQATSVSDLQAWIDKLPESLTEDNLKAAGFVEHVRTQLNPQSAITEGLTENDFFKLRELLAKKLPYLSQQKHVLPLLDMLEQQFTVNRAQVLKVARDASLGLRIESQGEEYFYAGTGNGRLQLTRKNGQTIALASDRVEVEPSDFTLGLPFFDRFEVVDIASTN